MEINSVGQGRQTSLDNNISEYIPEANTEMHVELAEKVFSEDSKSTKPVNKENVKKAVDKFNSLLENSPTHLEYEIYGKFKDTVIKIVDDNSKKVIKELPAKNIIDMVDKFCELAGLFVNEKA